MHMKKLIVAILFVATGSAFAQQREYVPADEGFVSTRTREEVKAEFEAAKKDGSLDRIIQSVYFGD